MLLKCVLLSRAISILNSGQIIRTLLNTDFRGISLVSGYIAYIYGSVIPVGFCDKIRSSFELQIGFLLASWLVLKLEGQCVCVCLCVYTRAC